MNLEKLIHETRIRMGATRAIRLKAAKERSRAFNEQCTRDYELQKLTPELLAKRCTL